MTGPLLRQKYGRAWATCVAVALVLLVSTIAVLLARRMVVRTNHPLPAGISPTSIVGSALQRTLTSLLREPPGFRVVVGKARRLYSPALSICANCELFLVATCSTERTLRDSFDPLNVLKRSKGAYDDKAMIIAIDDSNGSVWVFWIEDLTQLGNLLRAKQVSVATHSDAEKLCKLLQALDFYPPGTCHIRQSKTNLWEFTLNPKSEWPSVILVTTDASDTVDRMEMTHPRNAVAP